MLNRYSFIFYLTALAFTVFDKNIIALILFFSGGFIVGYIYSISNVENDDVDEPYSFTEILLFKNKNELLKAVKDELTEEKTEKAEESKFRIDIQKSLVFIAIYLSILFFLTFIFKDYSYLIFALAIPFLITTKEE